jgi:hypothetical protein
MSDQQPVEPTQPLDLSGDVETVGPEPAGPRRRRGAIVTAVAVAVAAVLGGGAYAAYSFLDGGGPRPADVLPASTVAIVSVDLDPSAGQKIAAIKSIRRFPALKKAVGLQTDDDLREFVFDKATEGSDCGSLDFDKDVKPWLGKRAAFAGVDLGEPQPAPVIALQISDPEKAKAGFDAIVKCADPDNFAFVVGDDYLIASDSPEHARAILSLGKDKPLADDAAYQKWTGEAGDSGVIGFYVAKRSAQYLDDLLDGFGTGFAAGPNPFTSAKDALDGFQGLGGTVRFADGGMELSVAAGGLSQVADSPSIGDAFGDLPGDTAVGLGFGVGKDYAEKMLDQTEKGSADFRSQAEQETGIELPGDLQTLLGSAVTVSLGGKAPASLDDIQGPDDLPVGVVIHGDVDKIKAVIAKIEDHLGRSLSDIHLEVGDASGKVAVGPGDYADKELLDNGDLGEQDNFRDAVPDADRAQSILYLDFDSTWRNLVVDAVTQEEGAASGDELDANTKPLRSLGLSAWADGDVTHALLKLTTN